MNTQIDIKEILNIIKANFTEEQLNIDLFKPDLIFVDIDCLKDSSEKLTLAISNEKIQVATVSKEPELDFSLYDFNIKDKYVLERYLMKVKDEGKYFNL